MNKDQYKKAVRMAKRRHQSSIVNGENPYLPVLDDILKNVDIISEVYLGLQEIPIKKIIGTKTHSRSTAFATNFMPLLREETEFASKWSWLCQIHVKEGIRDPIKVYEYLNRYYVLEGNKRVSVLKYFDAVSIPAYVIRMIPRKNNKSLQNRIYYEYLPFYDKTGVNYIWFTHEDSFKELLKYIGQEQHKWDEDLKKEFNQFYNRFRRMYLANGGQQLSITTGDAFLEYIKVYGYKKANKKDNKEIYRRIKNIWPEIELLAQKNPVDVLTQPVDEGKKGFISSITSMGMQKKKIKVAFVYVKTIEDSGWTYGHELGRTHIEQVFGNQIETSYVENVPEDIHAYKYIKKLADEGNNIIFTTVPTLINPTLKVAVEYPDVKFLNCSENMSYKHLRTYYGRIYEAKFLTGIIAGIMTKSNLIGYIANYPIAGVISGINAFALGAKLVNPNVKVKLIWIRIWKQKNKDKDINDELMDYGVDIVSSQESVVAKNNSEFGVYALKSSTVSRSNLKHDYIALPIWHWGVFYEKLIRSILSGTWKAVTDLFSSETKAINYWWGLSAGVVDIVYSNTLIPAETKKLVEFMKRMIMCGEYHPFTGPIYDQKENIRVKENEVLSNEQILTMNWLVDNVIGEIPKIEKEKSLSVPIVDMMGVRTD